jgi:hypothetical protein
LNGRFSDEAVKACESGQLDRLHTASIAGRPVNVQWELPTFGVHLSSSHELRGGHSPDLDGPHQEPSLACLPSRLQHHCHERRIRKVPNCRRCARTLHKTEIWVFEELGDDKLQRSPQRAHPEIPNVVGLTTRRGVCTQKDSQNHFSCELINEVGAMALTRLLVSLADSMSFLDS